MDTICEQKQMCSVKFNLNYMNIIILKIKLSERGKIACKIKAFFIIIIQ